MTYQHRTLIKFAQRGATEISPETLGKINEFTVRPLEAAELYVRTAVIGHNGIDRDGEVISPELLQNISQSLVGKGVFVRHPQSRDGDSGPGEGRIFETELRQTTHEAARTELKQPDLVFPDGDPAYLLTASFYMARAAVQPGLIEKIDAGIASDVSMAFSYGAIAHKETATGKKYKLYLGPGEGAELSLVWLGAQQGARITKHSKRNQSQEPDAMEITPEQEATLKAVKTVFGGGLTEEKANEIKKLADKGEQHDSLKAMADAGEKYKASLIDRIVTARRQLGMIKGDDDATLQTAKAAFSEQSIEHLESEMNMLEAAVPSGSNPFGSDDPNPEPTAAGGLRAKGATLKDYGVPS